MISTVGTSKETAIASRPPSPDMKRDRERDKERLRRTTSPEERGLWTQSQVNGLEIAESLPAPEELHQNLEERFPHDQCRLQQSSETGEGLNEIRKIHKRSSSQGIWGWARTGTGRLNIIGRLPHPSWKSSASIHAHPNIITERITENGISSSTRDDFSVPSATTTLLSETEHRTPVPVGRVEGLGISKTTTLGSPHFSQTKHSSDDLVAASSTDSTPTGVTVRTGAESVYSAAPTTDTMPRTPDTPTPQRRKKSMLTVADEASPAKSDMSVKPVRGKFKSQAEDKGQLIDQMAIESLDPLSQREEGSFSPNKSIETSAKSHNDLAAIKPPSEIER